jgi:uncharacterized protein (TIGR02444 family)
MRDDFIARRRARRWGAAMTSLTETKADAFWRFSLMLYARPGVAEALIALQDRAGHNVNLVLFGLWLAVCEGAMLDAAGLARAEAAMAGLDREVVQPLRRLRRALKGAADGDIRDLRRRVLALEIAAERRVQTRLAACAAGRRRAKGADRAALAAGNLRLILGGDAGSDEAAVLRGAIAGMPPRAPARE